jgi:hypothetical protein
MTALSSFGELNLLDALLRLPPWRMLQTQSKNEPTRQRQKRC